MWVTRQFLVPIDFHSIIIIIFIFFSYYGSQWEPATSKYPILCSTEQRYSYKVRNENFQFWVNRPLFFIILFIFFISYIYTSVEVNLKFLWEFPHMFLNHSFAISRQFKEYWTNASRTAHLKQQGVNDSTKHFTCKLIPRADAIRFVIYPCQNKQRLWDSIKTMKNWTWQMDRN